MKFKGIIMAIALNIKRRSFVDVLKKASRKEKILILRWIERDLLSEWDEYEEHPSVKEKIDLAIKDYNEGNIVDLDNIIL